MGNLFAFIIGIGFCILLFLALRKIMLWYWKVDEIIENQKQTNQLLGFNNALLNEQVTLLRQQIELTIGTDDVAESRENN